MRCSFISLLVMLLLCGCASKGPSLQQRQAYMAGQQQAIQAAQHPAQPQGPVVYFRGPVRNPVVPYTEGMTLSQALVSAYYTGFMNPLVVRIIRDGQVVVELKGIDLLHHEDAPLQAGDVVQVIE